MRQPLIRSALVLSALVVLGPYGCGQTGSDPPEFPEVLFSVLPAGQATFRVDSLIGGGVRYASVIGQEFTATAAFNFVLENAGPPFQGSFTLVRGDQITVTVTVISTTGQTQVSDATQPGKATASVSAGGTPATLTPPPSNPEVRFDVCAPLADASTCSTVADPGTFGVLFTGSVGDPIISHQTSGLTPTIYFLEAQQQTVSAVFTRQPFTGAILQGQLFIDGDLQQTQSSSRNVLISQDL